jgi:hypothetical protein
MSGERMTSPSARPGRHSVARVCARYLIASAGTNLLWEIVQLPLYTLWWGEPPGTIAYAVAHCTAGDVLIAACSLALAVLLAGRHGWPRRSYGHVAALAGTFGVTYTVFSEWLNVEIRKTWAYSDLMPVLPGLGTGLAPMLQWIVVPGLAFWWAARRSD